MKTQHLYLEKSETQQFMEISERENVLLIRRGAIGKPCLVYEIKFVTEGRALKHYERLSQEWLGKKFLPVSKSKNSIIEGSRAEGINAKNILDEDAYSKIFELGWGERLKNQNKIIFCFKSGLNYDGNFDFEDVADMGLTTGLIVDGDTHVSGILSQATYTYPNPILMLGNVSAESFVHRDSHLCIEGDLKVQNFVLGIYNDGSLNVGGQAHGKAWFSDDHDMSAGEFFLPNINNNDPESIEAVDQKYRTDDDQIDFEKISDCIWEGINPLSQDFVFKEKKYTSPYADVDAEKSEFEIHLEELARMGNVEKITNFLENWPIKDSEWEKAYTGRLLAPSTTAEQAQRLKAAKLSYQQLNGDIRTFEDCDPNIKKLLNKMTGTSGAALTLKVLRADFKIDLLKRHESIVMINVLISYKEHPKQYLELFEYLLDLGLMPNIEDSLVFENSEIVSALKKKYADLKIWVYPKMKVKNLKIEDCHPEIQRLIKCVEDHDVLSTLKHIGTGLDSGIDKDLLKFHKELIEEKIRTVVRNDKSFNLVLKKLKNRCE